MTPRLQERYREEIVPNDRLRLQFQGQIRYTNLDTGKTVDEQWNSVVVLEFANGVIYNNGNPVHINGDGRVMLSAGRLVIDMESGEFVHHGVNWPQEVAFGEPDYFPLLCEALSD